MPKNEGQIVRHLDGNPKNNKLDNLEWGTPKENHDDKYIHGTVQFGENHHSAILTKEQVIEARRLKRSGKTYKQLGAHFGMPAKSFIAAVDGTTWFHITEEKPVNSSRKVYTPEIINECARLRKTGLSYMEIGKYFGVTYATTSRWLKKWPNGI